MASKPSSCLKAGLQGGTGTGKSTTAALLELGLSVEYHSKAPVLVFDTEPGWHFLKPIFDVEGVKLIIENGRHFEGMHDALKKAVRDGCCGFIVDSITHPWAELLERFADRTGRVPFHKFNQIKPMWGDFIVDFMNAPLHAIANGRLAWEYAYEIAEDGKKELIKGDSKMKAGGGESFGYEPNLTCEMTRQQKRDMSGKIEAVEYVCTILKDRSRVLNSSEFIFTDIKRYQKGGYKAVLEAFRPHVDFLQELSGVVMPKATSAAIVPGGDSEFYRQQQQKKATLEDWDATIDKLFPGQTAANKQARAIVGEALTGVRSRTRFEAYDVGQIQSCVGILFALERRLRQEKWTNEQELLAIIARAKEDYRAAPQAAAMAEAIVFNGGDAEARDADFVAHGVPVPF